MTKQISARELKVGHRLVLQDGSTSKVTEIRRAPITIEHEDGSRETPKWAYLANGDHATVCKADLVTIA